MTHVDGKLLRYRDGPMYILNIMRAARFWRTVSRTRHEKKNKYAEGVERVATA